MMTQVNIKVNDRIKFKTCVSEYQQCVYCGKEMGVGTVGVMLSNATDKLSMKKNLWVHIACISKMSRAVRYRYNKCEKEIVAKMI